MTIRGEDIRSAAQIVIEEKGTKGQAEQACSSNRRGRSFVDEKPVTLVMIQPDHLISEIADQQVGSAGAIIIGSIDAHGSTRHAVLSVSDARLHAFFGKR